MDILGSTIKKKLWNSKGGGSTSSILCICISTQVSILSNQPPKLDPIHKLYFCGVQESASERNMQVIEIVDELKTVKGERMTKQKGFKNPQIWFKWSNGLFEFNKSQPLIDIDQNPMVTNQNKQVTIRFRLFRSVQTMYQEIQGPLSQTMRYKVVCMLVPCQTNTYRSV